MKGKLGITDKQADRMKELLTRSQEFQAGVPKVKDLTEKMKEELAGLIYRDKNPELPSGAKAYCQQWLKEQTALYGVKKTFESKFTMKGNMVEEQSFGIIGRHLGVEVKKNDEFFSNDWTEGTPDAMPIPEEILDAKNSWDPFSFPLFESKIPNADYYWQGQGYLDILPGTKKFKLAYVLCNTPESLIQREARNWAIANGYELGPELVEEFRARMTYDNVPDELKIRVFEFEKNETDIMRMHERVEMCRVYIKKLVEDINAGRGVETISEEEAA